MRFRLRSGGVARLFLCAALLASLSGLAFGQGAARTTLTGSVVDASGGVIPGADVVVKNNATGIEYRTVSDGTGHFSIEGITSGVYTATISLMGFKTVVLPDVTVVQGVAASVKPVVLAVGNLTETVTVTGATELIQTQSATVSTTLTTTQIARTPLPTRNTMDFVSMLPGVSTTSAARYSTVMGLPGSALNITIDGLNTQDQALKGTTSSSFFSFINPRLDAVEEVTVSTTNPGAESSGQGAVQIRFQTRSGTNQFRGSAYQYLRKTKWNTNYWFNENANDPKLPNDKADNDTYGFRIGGPIKKDRAFFFFNYEKYTQPQGVSRTRTVLTPDALAGRFQVTGGPLIDLYALARSYSQTSTPDPAIAQMLSDINATLAGQSVTAGTNSVTNSLTFQNSGPSVRYYPTTRVDFNVTKNNRIGASVYIQKFVSDPDILNNRDPVFPGYKMQGNQFGWRPSVMLDWRSVLGPNVVNQARGGYMGWLPTHFSDNITADQFPGGKRLAIPGSLVSAPYAGGNWEQRASPAFNIEDSVTWMKGKHSIGFGGAYSQVGYKDTFQYYVPNVGLGFDSTNDPAAVMFTSANFAGAGTSDLTNARSLYALLTGRVTSLNNTAYLSPDGTYQYMGPWQYYVKQREYGFYVTDSWRIRPSLTLTGGLRYELQMPFTSQNHYFTRLTDPNMLYGMSGLDASGNPNYFYKPGAANNGVAQPYVTELTPSASPFNVDKNNVAPSAGVAWRIPVKSGSFWSKLLSQDPVLRGGYTKAYTREGLTTTSGIYAANPGGNYPASRNNSLGNLINPGQTWPLLYRDAAQLGAPAFPSTPTYPMATTFSNSINDFVVDTQTPWVHSFNVGFARTLAKNMVVEARYVGTRARGGWVDGGRNINELNVVENGWITEFQHAQANYLINEQTYGWNSAAGNSFAYKGLPGQFPLPIYQAFYTGVAGTAGDPTKYTSSNYTNSTQLNRLAPTNPVITGTSSQANEMFTDATMRANGIKAGYPANFFYMNPSISGGVWVTGRPEDQGKTNFDAVQIELRRRMSAGLLLQGSYQYIIRAESSSYFTVRTGPEMVRQASPVHALKLNWSYELPFGQGKKWGGGASRALNAVIGGWSFDGTGRIQSGNILDYGNVRLVGWTDKQLQDNIKVYKIPDATNPKITRVYMLPQDFINNTILAYQISATSATGYSGATPTGAYFAPISSDPACLQVYRGACGNGGVITPSATPTHRYVNGPMFVRFDLGLTKRFDLTRKVNGELRLEALNAFDAINFSGTTSYGGSAVTAYAITSSYRDQSNTQDPGGRLLQFSWRINF
jgi:hypothetical protein